MLHKLYFSNFYFAVMNRNAIFVNQSFLLQGIRHENDSKIFSKSRPVSPIRRLFVFMDITVDSLKAIGFIQNPDIDSPFPIKRELPELWEDSENECPCIAITVLRNVQEFCFLTGTGTMIYLNINSISDIIKFRDFISGIDNG